MVVSWFAQFVKKSHGAVVHRGIKTQKGRPFANDQQAHSEKVNCGVCELLRSIETWNALLSLGFCCRCSLHQESRGVKTQCGGYILLTWYHHSSHDLLSFVK